MTNITQIQIDDVTYDICDIASKNIIWEAENALICDGTPTYDPTTATITNPAGSSNANRGRLFTEQHFGNACFSTGISSNSKSYIFNLFGETGSIRLDSYDHTTDTRSILGYVPLISSVTKNCVKVINNTSLITPADGWSVYRSIISQWGQVVQLNLGFKTDSEVTVNASGNIANIHIGTLNSDYWPPVAVHWSSSGDYAGPTWGYINPDGKIIIGAVNGRNASYSIAADSIFLVYTTYLLPMNTNNL